MKLFKLPYKEPVSPEEHAYLQKRAAREEVPEVARVRREKSRRITEAIIKQLEVEVAEKNKESSVTESE